MRFLGQKNLDTLHQGELFDLCSTLDWPHELDLGRSQDILLYGRRPPPVMSLHRLLLRTARDAAASSRRILTRPLVRFAASSSSRSDLQDGPDLAHFIQKQQSAYAAVPSLPVRAAPPHPYVDDDALDGAGRTGEKTPNPLPPDLVFHFPILVFVDVHGCQMNVSDAEVAWAVLQERGYTRTSDPIQADVWLIVTCSIREGAEAKVFKKLINIQRKKKKGVYRWGKLVTKLSLCNRFLFFHRQVFHADRSPGLHGREIEEGSPQRGRHRCRAGRIQVCTGLNNIFTKLHVTLPHFLPAA